MEELLQQLQQELKTAAKVSSDWLATVAQQSNEAVDQLLTNSLEMAEEIDHALAPTLAEMNDRMEQAVDDSFTYVDQQLMPWIEQASAPVTRTVNPWLQNHTACIGCQHYHGTQYGQEMLVCAMHPYGAQEETCRDWESVWENDEQE